MCAINVTAFSTFPRSMRIQSIKADQICAHWDGEMSAASQRERNVDEVRDEYDECHTTHIMRDQDTLDENVRSETTSQIAYPDSDRPQIVANGESYIDRLLIFVPKICDDRCKIVAKKEHLNAMVVDIKERFKMVRQKLLRFRALAEQYQRISLHVQTNHIKRYDFNGSIQVHWPKLVSGPIQFPITQIGHVLFKRIEITNPLDEPIEIFYQLHDMHSDQLSVDEMPSEVLDKCWNCTLTPDRVFSLDSTTYCPHRAVPIPPKSSTHLNIRFTSNVAGLYGTLLHIHNNFTVLESVWLSAKSVVPLFKFGNRRPGSKTPLLFELTDKNLRDCAHPNVNMRGVTSKRSFTAKNNGEVPIELRTLRIDNLPCEGYGYRITDCAPFELAPNGSKKIEISFTPDFTLAMVKKTLHLETSLNYSVNYTLLSMISPLSLGICSKALARPDWESTMKHVTAVVLAVSFLCVLFAAYLDSIKVLKVHWESASKGKDSGQTLDLRQIALNSLNSDDAKSPQTSNRIETNSKQQNTSAAGKANVPLISKRKSNDNREKRRANGSTTGSATVSATATPTVTPTTTPTATPTATPTVTSTSSVDHNAAKKSWASEIARKFTSKKPDASGKVKAEAMASSSITAISSAISSTFTTKAKNMPSSAAMTTTAALSTSSGNINTCKKNQAKHKDDTTAAPTNAEEEEETSSTTTDSSYNSDDKLTKAKKSNQLKDLTNASTKNIEHPTSAGMISFY